MHRILCVTIFVSVDVAGFLSIIILSGVRVSYKTAHTTTDTMANKINTVKNTYCQNDDDSESFVLSHVIGSLIIMMLLPV